MTAAIVTANTSQGEIFKDTKARLQKRTGIQEKQFEKIKFALVPRALYSKAMYLNDGSCPNSIPL